MGKGWNLISTPVRLSNNAIDVALQSIVDQLNSVWTWVCDPAHPEGGYWLLYAPGSILSDLATFDPGCGYWVDMEDAAVLSLTGQDVTGESIQLRDGWNLGGCNSLTSQPAEDAFQSIAGNLTSAWVWICDPTYAEGGYWLLYVPDSILSDLKTLEPGMGVWIDATGDCQWNITGGVQAAPMLGHGNAGTLRRGDMVSSHRPDVPYIIWGSVEVGGVKTTGRDTACRVPTVLLKVGGKVQSSYRLGAVRRYGDFYRLEVPGTDDSAQVQLYIQTDDAVAKAAPVPPGRPGQIVRLDLSVQLLPTVSQLLQNYPNPFNPDTWMPYQLRKDASVVIRIYTSTGQLVRTLRLGHKPAGFYTGREKAAYWDGRNEAGEHVASGIYFYSVEAGSYSATRKMTVVR